MAGSHAEYVRLPFADHGAFTVPGQVDDLAACSPPTGSPPAGWARTSARSNRATQSRWGAPEGSGRWPPALGVGNAVVLKPAGDTPITGGLLLAKIYEEAGLPAGVLNVIVGRGSEVGDPMVTHDIRCSLQTSNGACGSPAASTRAARTSTT